MVTYIKAVNQALADEMAADDRVCLFGEDVAAGGAFGATRGLVDRFGAQRVRNTPISEEAIVGMAVGAACAGLRPVVEVMFIDFLTLAMDPLVNHAAKLRFMSGGQLRVPMVLRTQSGTIGGAGAQHSQSLEAWLTHVPGLKVVAPSTPAEAYGLLRASIRDDNPVVVVEPKGNYVVKEDLPEDPEPAVIGRAQVRRHGSHVTVVSYGGGVLVADGVAEELAARDIEVEVVDLRSLVPLDLDTVLESVARTGRAVVFHDAVGRSGFGAEIAASIQEAAFDQLAAPVRRVAAPPIPVPAAVALERSLFRGREELREAVVELLARPAGRA